ncbi:MAG: HAD-IIIA family hydrolase [Flavobacteriaceae bacterium]|nr:HAD-IIIA family hydrolase [Flavobacteriaceae bacterium]
MKNYKEYLNDIRTFVFDVDGVLTDGSFIITTSGELLRSMNTKDGFAIKIAHEKGYRICIISGGNNEGVKHRLRELGITDLYFGSLEKRAALDEFLDINQIEPKTVLYMGDDIPDLEAMQLVALPTCPQDAVPEVKKMALYVSHKKGGKGCVRDVIEQVLRVHGNWNF